MGWFTRAGLSPAHCESLPRVPPAIESTGARASEGTRGQRAHSHGIHLSLGEPAAESLLQEGSAERSAARPQEGHEGELSHIFFTRRDRAEGQGSAAGCSLPRRPPEREGQRFQPDLATGLEWLFSDGTCQLLGLVSDSCRSQASGKRPPRKAAWRFRRLSRARGSARPPIRTPLSFRCVPRSR